MGDVSRDIAERKPVVCSRQTNRPLLIAGIDNRGRWARRRRDVLSALLAELGRVPSQRDRALAGNVATILVRCEQISAQVASGEAVDDAELVRLTNLTARMLNALKAESVSPKAVPGLGQYLRDRAAR